MFRGAIVVGSLLAVFAGSAQAKVSVRSFVIDRVIDGDTVHGHDDQKQPVKIRMQGIDSPESHLITDEGRFAQAPWGDEASNSLTRMLPVGSRAELEDFGQDKYGRTLGHIVLNGLNANIEQVRQGQAVSYIICEAGGCSKQYLDDLHVEEITTACRSAQKAGLGIFNPSKPLTEMPFEFRLKHQHRKADKFIGSLTTREYVAPGRHSEIPVCDRIFFLNEQDAKASGFQRK